MQNKELKQLLKKALENEHRLSEKGKIALNNLLKKQLYIQAKDDFYTFATLICKELKPHFNLNEKWLLASINAFQEVIDSNDTCRLIVNVRPRLGKTTFITILGSCWVLGKMQDKRILIATASDKLKDAIRVGGVEIPINAILSSKTYKEIFSDLKIIKNNDTGILTDKYGSLILTVAGSTAIGLGYHFIIFDDFFNPNHISSDANTETARMHLRNFLTRTEHQPKTKIFGIEQRIHIDNDFTGTCKKYWDEFKVKYIHIVIPNEIKEDLRIEVNNKVIEYKAGEWIDKRANIEEKQQILANLNGDLSLYETLYQQNPQNASGVYFKDYHFNNLMSLQEMRSKTGFYIISVDPATSNNKSSDYTGIAVLKIADDRKVYLEEIHQYKGNSQDLVASWNTLVDYIIHIKNQYQNIGQGRDCGILIEVNGIGSGFPSAFQNKGVKVFEIRRNASMNKSSVSNQNLKEYMAQNIAFRISNGTVILPKLEDVQNMYMFKNQLLAFPNGQHDDMIDAFTNGIQWLASENYII